MKKYLNELEDSLESYFGKKLPEIPSEIQEPIIVFGPWVLLVLIIMNIPAVLGILGSIGTVLMPWSHIGGSTTGLLVAISGILTILTLALECMALPGLFQKSLNSWRLVFYALLVSIVQSIVLSNILGALLFALIGFYIMFQIKHHYK